MPTWTHRQCSGCGKTDYTASKSVLCLLCHCEQKRAIAIATEHDTMANLGYSVISGPTIDKFNHRVYRLMTPCGHEWETPYTNFTKQISNSHTKQINLPCGTCGPRHRIKAALAGYMQIYAADYDVTVAHDYTKKVRIVSNRNYQIHMNVINPQGLPRSRHDYHLDHIVPIIQCFKLGWSVEEAAAPAKPANVIRAR